MKAWVGSSIALHFLHCCFVMRHSAIVLAHGVLHYSATFGECPTAGVLK